MEANQLCKISIFKTHAPRIAAPLFTFAFLLFGKICDELHIVRDISGTQLVKHDEA